MDNKIKFLQKGREGKSEIEKEEKIPNDKHVGNAGKWLYKTTYTDGSFEVRDFRGNIVDSGSERI